MALRRLFTAIFVTVNAIPSSDVTFFDHIEGDDG